MNISLHNQALFRFLLLQGLGSQSLVFAFFVHNKKKQSHIFFFTVSLLGKCGIGFSGGGIFFFFSFFVYLPLYHLYCKNRTLFVLDLFKESSGVLVFCNNLILVALSE